MSIYIMSNMAIMCQSYLEHMPGYRIMRMLRSLFALVVASEAVALQQSLLQEWNSFKLQYNKTYSDESEERSRSKTFISNMETINEHNAQFEEGLVTFKLEMNQFGDMSHEEFLSKLNRRNRAKHLTPGPMPVQYTRLVNDNIPKAVDWRREGAVTPVKNQGRCLAGWAFSATGSLEGQFFRKYKQLVSLSEQNLIDCTGEFGNDGCGKGFVENVFRFLSNKHGINTESDYPYEGQEGPCRYKPTRMVGSVTDYVPLKSGDEMNLQYAVAHVGPISASIDAGHKFRFYRHGVYYEPRCSGDDVNHAVLIVGYGTSDEGKDYWLVKNSWGRHWGEEGYIKMIRNKDNNCGIATMPTFPLV